MNNSNIVATLLKMEKEDSQQRIDELSREKRWRSVPRETGKFLYQLVMLHQPQIIVEIGMSQGYSTIWMGLAAQSYGGKIFSYEIEKWRYDQANRNFSVCQLDDTIEANLVQSDFSDYPLDIDMLFIDAEKSDYLTHIKNTEEKLNATAIIVADNTVSHKEELREYIDYMRQSDKYFSTGLTIGKGLELSRRINKQEKQEIISKL